MSDPARRLPAALGGGLTLRSMSPADAGELAAFLIRVMARDGEPDEIAGIWAAELLRGDDTYKHPTSHPGDGTVVVDDETGRIVSCCFLIRQTWTYAGIPFGTARPELIATEPAFRNRGLVRAQLAEIHARSASFGHVLQFITGIPYFYRQFGYEPALITAGSRKGSISNVPPLPPGGREAIRFRPAAEADLPFIVRMYEQAAERSLVSAVRDEAIWRYELLARDPGSDYWHELRIVESTGGVPLGLLAYLPQPRDGTLTCTLFELIEGVSWESVTPAVLRALRDAGEAVRDRVGTAFSAISFDWTPDHPVLAAAAGFFAEPGPPYAFQIRIAGLPEFIRLIAPALEARLARSPLAGFDGALRIACYPSDLLVVTFTSGRLGTVEMSPLDPSTKADAAFPGRTFLQLLLGSRALTELEYAFPGEARVRDDATRQLLDTLFPKQPSAVWPVA